MNGILTATQEQWETAQEMEKKGWMEIYPHAFTDRQHQHFTNFDNYNCIKDIDAEMTIKSAIELGCGPFTNLQQIHGGGLLRGFLEDLREITLLDPLVKTYLEHENCAYKNGKLNTVKPTLLAIPIEKLDVSKKYDMVVVINVIEHCYSIPKILDTVLDLLPHGGVLVFSEPCIYENMFEVVQEQRRCNGHPIAATWEYYDEWLGSNFDTVFRKDYDNLHPPVGRKDIYFIGTLK